jgi:hypothetical protein
VQCCSLHVAEEARSSTSPRIFQHGGTSVGRDVMLAEMHLQILIWYAIIQTFPFSSCKAGVPWPSHRPPTLVDTWPCPCPCAAALCLSIMSLILLKSSTFRSDSTAATRPSSICHSSVSVLLANVPHPTDASALRFSFSGATRKSRGQDSPHRPDPPASAYTD